MSGFEEYIEKVLGLRVEDREGQRPPLQRFLLDSYKLQPVSINGADFIAATPIHEAEPGMRQLRTQLSLVGEAYGCPVILVLSNLTAQRRRSLIMDKVAFVVPGKQLYIPQLAMCFREYPDPRAKNVPFRPITQLVFLYMLYCREDSFSGNALVERLGVSKMGISRAGQELEQAGLILREEDRGRIRFVRNATPKELFQSARPYLVSPVRATRLEHGRMGLRYLYTAGLDALAHCTMLASPSRRVYARKDAQIDAEPIGSDQEFEEIEVQLWRYEPAVLARNGVVDPLSLALSLEREMADPRVEGAVEELLESVWEGAYERDR